MFAVPLYSTCSQPSEPFSTTSSPASGNLSSQQNTIQTVLDSENIQFQLYGNQFKFRSAERAGRKFKHKETIELWKKRSRTSFTDLSTGRTTTAAVMFWLWRNHPSECDCQRSWLLLVLVCMACHWLFAEGSKFFDPNQRRISTPGPDCGPRVGLKRYL